MHTFTHREGSLPIVVSVPHAGMALPAELTSRLTPAGLERVDTDWHVPRLYDFLEGWDVTQQVAKFSRYVVDLNRPPDDTPLYEGATNGLCPTQTFSGAPIYLPGQEPSTSEIAERIRTYHTPYHQQIVETLARLRAAHRKVVLVDLHSIASNIPRLFDGVLPHFNIGTSDGHSAESDLTTRVYEHFASYPEYEVVANERFKGGYITRRYGLPDTGVHAIQLELAQRSYMREDCPQVYDAAYAARVRPVLEGFFALLRAWVGQ